jgi:Zn-dependent peptidase ImmA (M78 family)
MPLRLRSIHGATKRKSLRRKLDSISNDSIWSRNLAQWEQGDEMPSVPQLRSLAGLYRRPLAVFYLQEVPLRFQVLSDLRRARSGEIQVFSPVLTQEIRAAQQRRALAQELAADLGESIEAFRFRLGASSPEDAGNEIRRFLGLSVETILKSGKDPTGRAAFNAWRDAIERSGALVFQSSKIPQTEASGFALAYDEAPVVVVNRKDAPQRRLFSLLHEFAHVALRQSGVSDLRIAREQTVEDADVEMRCNSIAAAALMPMDAVSAELQDAIGSEGGLTDVAVSRLARRFGVSRPALLLRLVRARQVTWNFYFEKDAQYTAAYERELANRDPQRDMKRNIPQESLSDLGRPFIGLVLDNYHQRNITLSDVAGYLGVRVKHVETLERRMVS